MLCTSPLSQLLAQRLFQSLECLRFRFCRPRPLSDFALLRPPQPHSEIVSCLLICAVCAPPPDEVGKSVNRHIFQSPQASCHCVAVDVGPMLDGHRHESLSHVEGLSPPVAFSTLPMSFVMCSMSMGSRGSFSRSMM